MKIIIKSKKFKKEASAGARIADEVADIIRRKVKELHYMDVMRENEEIALVMAELQHLLQGKRFY